MGTRMIVDLSQKVGTFTADTTRYVRTHIKAVDGLLDGGGLLNLSLLPTALKIGLKPIGGISYDSLLLETFDQIWSHAGTFDDGNGVMEGHYVNIDIDGTFIVSSGHIITNGDDGGGAIIGNGVTPIKLEKNDWLVFQGIDASNNKKWQIMNHTYPEATTTAAGLMSSGDKTKLNGIDVGANNYTHPTFSPANIVDLSSSHTIKSITFDNGHISAIETQAITSASVSVKGLVELLSQVEARSTTLDTSRAATHSTVRDIMKYFEQIKVYSAQATGAGNLSDANLSAEHGEGAFVFIKTGEVEVV